MQIGPARTRPRACRSGSFTSSRWSSASSSSAACRALAPLPAAVMVARPAGPAAGLGAGPGRVDPRPVRQCHRLDVPPPRHRAGASGLAGAVPRHRGVRRQREGGFRAGLPACGLQWWENPDIVPGMIGETAATPAADRNGVAAVAAGGCRCSTAGTARRACRSRGLRRCRPSGGRFCACTATGPPTGPPRVRPPPGAINLLRLTNGARAWPAPPS